MQQVCNTNINDMYGTFFGRDTGKCPFLYILLIASACYLPSFGRVKIVKSENETLKVRTQN
jgi:hypothetical protein